MTWYVLIYFLVLSGFNRNCLMPQLHENWWQIAGVPELGTLDSPTQQPVDFGIWQAKNDTWQVWSCIRKTKEGGKTRLFYGWSSENLYHSNWRPLGIMLRSDTTHGEELGGLQAPFVIPHQGQYWMFYGDWNRICLATSEDGQHFSRLLRHGDPSLFGDLKETNTRDAMVLSVGDYWICYYTAHPEQDGAIYARTSHDLLHWSDSRRVSYGGHVGKGKFWQAECPFVVAKDGCYYLFRTENYGINAKTNIYCSRDPLDFGIDSDRFFVGSIPVAAPEIFQIEGVWYLACLNPDLDGIRIGTFHWTE